MIVVPKDETSLTTSFKCLQTEAELLKNVFATKSHSNFLGEANRAYEVILIALYALIWTDCH